LRDRQQPALERAVDDAAADEPRLRGAADIGRREGARCCAEHRQVLLGVADRDRVGVGTDNPVA